MFYINCHPKWCNKQKRTWFERVNYYSIEPIYIMCYLADITNDSAQFCTTHNTPSLNVYIYN